MSMFGSMEIITNALMTKNKVVHVKKSRWCRFLDFCLQWNPCDTRGRSPDTKVIQVPSDEFLVMTNRVICHPSMLHILRDSIGSTK